MTATTLERGEHHGAESLLMRLEDQATLAALHKLLDRIDVVAFAAEAVDGVIRRGDTIADSIGDSVKDIRKLAATAEPLAGLASQIPQLAATGEKVAALTQTSAFQNLIDSGLLQRLGEPATITQLHSLLDQLELVAFSVKLLDGFIRRGEQLVDNIAGLVGEARKAGNPINSDDLKVLNETAQGLLGAARQLQQEGALAELPKLTDTLVHLLQSGIFDPNTVRSLAEVGNLATRSYINTKNSKPEPLGPLGIWKAMSDPDVQRSLGFMLGMAKQYGQLIR